MSTSRNLRVKLAKHRRSARKATSTEAAREVPVGGWAKGRAGSDPSPGTRHMFAYPTSGKTGTEAPSNRLTAHSPTRPNPVRKPPAAAHLPPASGRRLPLTAQKLPQCQCGPRDSWPSHSLQCTALACAGSVPAGLCTPASGRPGQRPSR